MTNAAPWYHFDRIEKLDSPALLVYPERVRSNIATAIRMIGDVNRLRPHVKTHKSPQVTQLMLAAGISKFKCATIAEAEMLARQNAPDVLLAYQPVGPKLLRFISLIQTYAGTKFSCLCDSMDVAVLQSAAFAANGLQVAVFMDVNTGMNRSGITPGDEAIRLYSWLANAPGITVAGLHAYDGHIRDTDITIRKKLCDDAFSAVEKLRDTLEQKGLPVPVVIAGGSPTFPVHATRLTIECSPGTFVYWDKGYLESCPEQSFLPAAVLMTRVVSLPDANTVCTDLGHKSVAAENEIGRRIFFLDIDGITAAGQSEEHLVLKANAGHSFRTGDVLFGLPYHVCPTVALYEKAYTIENGKLTGDWENIARDRTLTI